MKFRNPYWSTTTKIQMLEDWVLVHSILYYKLDSSIVPDSQFDHNAHQLARALQKYPQEAARTKYAYCFKNFDGSTGHHLYDQLKEKDKERLFGRAMLIQRLR